MREISVCTVYLAGRIMEARELLQECDVEVQPDCVPSSCLDENECLTTVQSTSYHVLKSMMMNTL